MADAKIDSFDIGALEKAVNDSAGRVSGIWLSFVAFSAYLAAAASMITHRQIFLEEPIKLPTVNIDLPLVASAILLPLLFVIYHIFVLLQVVLLARTADTYNEAIEHAVPEAPDRTRIRQRLANTLFAQLFAGSPREREGVLGWLLRSMAWITLAIAPVFVLVVFEIKFLPYHSAAVTWTHRGLIALDVLAVLSLWAAAISPSSDIQWSQLRPHWKLASCGAFILLLSFFIVTFPGEKHTAWMLALGSADPATPPSGLQDEDQASFAPATIDVADCRTPWLLVELFPSSFDRLSLAGASFVESDKLSKISSAGESRQLPPDKFERTRNLAKRDLRCAILSAADLRYVDVSDADLSGARLDGAQLMGARLERTNLRGASLAGAQLQGVGLHRAALQGAHLTMAQLQKAVMTWAQLQGASLKGTNLDGADLTNAGLEGATLSNAQLRGTILTKTGLSLAALDGARLQGALLNATELDNANLERAQLHAANIGASFAGADLSEVQLQGAEISFAKFPGALILEAQLQGANLEATDLGDAIVAKSHLWRVTNFDCDKARVTEPRLDHVIYQRRPTRLIVPYDRLGPEDAARFIEDVTADIPEPTKSKVADKMRDTLSAGRDDVDEDDRAQRYWTYCAEQTATRQQDKYDGVKEQLQSQRRALLIELACSPGPGQPHIAAGIYRNVFEVSLEPTQARRLLGETDKPCQGTRGIGQDISAQLRKTARQTGK
jgi:uncharacterized protein YjbI with pentapeptide repeats